MLKEKTPKLRKIAEEARRSLGECLVSLERDHQFGVDSIAITMGRSSIVIRGESRAAALRLSSDVLQSMLTPLELRVAIEALEIAIKVEKAKETPDQIDIQQREDTLRRLRATSIAISRTR